MASIWKALTTLGCAVVLGATIVAFCRPLHQVIASTPPVTGERAHPRPLHGAPDPAVQAAPTVAGNVAAPRDLSDDGPDHVADLVAAAQDCAVPLERREQEVRFLARGVDESSVRQVIALADANVYLSTLAIETLGEVRRPQAVACVRRHLVAGDMRRTCAAVKALGRGQGEAAIDAIADLLVANRKRPDGFEAQVWQAAAEALASIASPKALPLLERELAWVGAEARHLEYGSQLVTAVQATRDPRGAALLVGYGDRLAARIPEEPRPKDYVQSKIAEARAVAAVLAGPGK